MDYLSAKLDQYPTIDEVATNPVPKYTSINHSCRHCRSIVISPNAGGSVDWEKELCTVHDAVEAAMDDCSWYGSILDHLCRSKPDMKTLDKTNLFLLFMNRTTSPFDILMVQIMIETARYSWPCETFDIIAEAGNTTDK